MNTWSGWKQSFHAQHNIELKASKCEFLRSRVKYLGNVVSKDGIETDPEKTEKRACFSGLHRILPKVHHGILKDREARTDTCNWFSSTHWLTMQYSLL